jgi:glycosyltransferase involved in cell wall biosynthesis
MSSRALGFARPLVQQGFEVCLFMPPWQTPEDAGQTWQQEGVDFSYISVTGGTLGIARRLLRETLQWQPDVVHCFKPKAYSGLVAWWIWQFQRQRRRLIVDTDDWEGWGGWNDRAPYTPGQKRFFAWQERWGMRHCHQLTVASKTLQSIAWSQGIHQDKVTYLPNGAGLPVEQLPTAEAINEKRKSLALSKRPVLLLYSRLFEADSKRLAKILAAVHAAVPNLAVLSIGKSLFTEDAARLQEELAGTPLAEAIIDLGWVDPGQLPVLLACADAAIYLMDDTLLNRTKCPVKLADLIGLGVPVVAEAVGQVPEYVVSGRHGYLSPSGAMDQLVDNVVSLLKNERERLQMAEEARVYYRANFAWELLAKRLAQVYRGSN